MLTESIQKTVVLANSTWGQTILTAGVTLVSILLAQSVILWIYRLGEKRRVDPTLQDWCSKYSASLGILKYELSEMRPLTSVADLVAAQNALHLVAPISLEEITTEIETAISLAIDAYFSEDEELFEERRIEIFAGHQRFKNKARELFGLSLRAHVGHSHAISISRASRFGGL